MGFNSCATGDTICHQLFLMKMHCFKLIVPVCMAVILGGCVTQPRKIFPPPADYVPLDKVKILSKFQTIEISQNNLATEVNKCVPPIDVNAESVKKGVSGFPSANIVIYGHASSASKFWVTKTTGLCLQASSEKFPILAAEAFIDSVNPVGVPPDVTDGWYQQIALLIATKGAAKIAYTFDIGTAFVVDYWVESRSGGGLNYSSSFRKAGAWESDALDHRFSHPTMSSVSQTKRGGNAVKVNFLSHRLP